MCCQPHSLVNFRGRSGQTMVEYVLAFAGLLVVVSLMVGFIGLVQRYGVRSERLVASEYP